MKVLHITAESIDTASNEARYHTVLGETERALRKGEVVACPTDTVYGLVADAANAEAVKKVFQIKEREKRKALPVFVRDIKMAKELAHISTEQEKFLSENWPGKITVILESKHELPKELEYEGRIALRIPDYEIVNDMLEKLNRPITGTSANISGKDSCSSAAEVIEQFRKRKYQPDLVLDAGVLPKSKPSTVIDITGETPKIIRK